MTLKIPSAFIRYQVLNHFFYREGCRVKSFRASIQSIKAAVLQYTSQPYSIKLGLISPVALVYASMASPLLPAEESVLLNNHNFNQYINADRPVNGTYSLEESIDLSQYDQWQPVGNDSVPFSVELNGNYQIISGLKNTNKTDNAYAGLFGYLVNSRVERLIIDKPVIESEGQPISIGSVAGRVKNTTVAEVINHSGSINVKGNNVNAGGIVGIASDYSIIKNNLATGEIKMKKGTYGLAGGIAASVQTYSIITGNLFAGELKSGYIESSNGGIAGSLSGNSSANNNLHTGSITSVPRVAVSDYGGIVGRAVEGATIASNLNSGSLKLQTVIMSTFGGVVGLIENSATLEQNVNAGALYQDGGGSDVGGIVGRAIKTPIQQNMNNGEVTYNLFSKKPIGIGRIGGLGGLGYDLIAENNLNTADIIVGHLISEHYGTIDGEGVRGEHNLQVGRVLVNQHSNQTDLIDRTPQKTGHGSERFDKTLWNSSPDKTYPMLRNINGNYQDLLRLNNTQNGNNRFPAILDQFAAPGGSSNASLLDLTVWNVRDGYLPMLSGVSGQQAALAGINCEPGGFACSAVSTMLPTATSLSSSLSSSQPSRATPSASTDTSPSVWTIAATTTALSSTAAPAPTTDAIDDNCLPPKGKPLAQTYDMTNNQLYVVIRTPSKPDNLVLARYTGTMLDQQFGRCGKITYQLPEITDWHFIETDLILSKNNHRYIHLLANTSDKKSWLVHLRLPQETVSVAVPEKDNDEADYKIDYLNASGFKVNMMAAQNGALYLAGRSSSGLFISHFANNGTAHFEPLGKKKLSSLLVSPDNRQLYIAGVKTTTHTAFLQAYNAPVVSPDKSFGFDGEVTSITPDHFQSHKAVATIHKGWIYIATITRNGDRLSIRRLDPDNGQIDGTFVIDEALPSDLTDSDAPAGIQLCSDGQLIHAVKYDNKGNVFIASYDDLREVYRTSKSLGHTNVLFKGLTVTGNRMYLPYRQSNELGAGDIVKVMEISVIDPRPYSSNPSGFPVWGYIVIAVVPAIITIASVVIFLKCRAVSYPLRRQEAMRGLSPLTRPPGG